MNKLYILLIGISLMVMAGCGQDADTSHTNNKTNDNDLTSVSFVLEWTPNTNHTGIYVAKDKGYFADEGLDVDIMLPGEVGSNQLIATGKADFGVSVQERLTIARDEDLPLVSIAAVIQHNTAGYASPVENDITEPADFEGRIFGGVGTDLEQAMMKTIMEENGADFSKVEITNIGDSDFFTAVKRDVDFSLVYQGWTGIEAELRDEELNMVYLKDFTEQLDFYTPILATNEMMIEENPDTVKAFVHAAVKGYEYAIEHPEDAADILIEQEPDLDPSLVKRSQKWLAPKYQDDAEQFGIQEKERWELVSDFMLQHDIIDEAIDVNKSFTNEFLPTK